MIKDVVTYLNNKITALGYFNEVLFLAELIEREKRVYPALYNNNNEYKEINLDPKGSLCYWRKNGNITYSKSSNETGIGVQYIGTIPLKLVGFIKKEDATNDTLFADNICVSLISNLTVNNSAFKLMLKAKRASISAINQVTDAREVIKTEYDNIDFDIRYTHAYFSIDFQLEFLSNSQCYVDLCNNNPINPLHNYNFCEDYIYDQLTNTQKICLTQRCTGTMSYQEISVVSGVVNSINNIFVLAHTALQVFKNGQLLVENVGYTQVGVTITFIVTPLEDIAERKSVV